jgi:YHS domain-containing protein
VEGDIGRMNPMAVSDGGRAKDPVCGMTVDPQSASCKTEYRGKTYYFCCQHCLAKFQSNPESYVEGKKEEPPAQTGAVYTCPMDPEIRQDKPGACPKCGMALEPRTVEAGEEENPELTYMKKRHVDFYRNAPGHPGGFMVRLALFRARMEINRKSKSEHVHIDWTGRWSGLPLQPDCSIAAGNLPGVISG